jgi:hypothetical protein
MEPDCWGDELAQRLPLKRKRKKSYIVLVLADAKDRLCLKKYVSVKHEIFQGA